MVLLDVPMRLAKPKVKRTRAGRPKVKTGCTTCKVRRIKCDEAKPHCQRCTSTGRNCDGYVTLPIDKESALQKDQALSVAAIFVSPWNRLLDYKGTTLEHRYLVFFQQQTAPVLSGYFDSYFWNGLLLQVGHSEPTIQHAMMAVASIHEQVEFAGDEISSPGQRNFGREYGRYFALQQYNKAIACLNERLSQGPRSEEITLMCCVLFICLEFLRGNIDTAISHLNGGLEIMAAWRTRNRRLLHDEALPVTAEPQSVQDNLVQMFSRLSIQYMLCGQDPPSANTIIAKYNIAEMIPIKFASLQMARASLDFLMKVSLEFLRESHKIPFRIPPDAEGKLDNLTNALNKWSLAFDLFLAGSLSTRTAREIRAAANLRILSIVAKVWLSNAVSDQECIFDKETPAFSAIVNLAATANSDGLTADSTPKPTSPPSSSGGGLHSFTFEMGFIPPLYFVAIKCRVPSIRRMAVAQLSTTMPRREGIWFASVYVAIAKRVIELEEVDLQSTGHMDEVTGEMLPSERNRLKDVKILSRAEEYLAEKVQKVTFISYPNGPDGPVEELEEAIRW